MWTLKNHTPYMAAGSWGRDKEGVHEWIVAVKATYDIKSDGKTALSPKQMEPLLIPEYNGEEGLSSLKYDADLDSAKPATDVVINGTAYAPGGRPSADFLVEARVDKIKKRLRVIGDRQWRDGLFGISPSEPEPLTQIPLVYERAYGGFDQTDPDPRKQRMDSRNPVGCGIASRAEHNVGRPVANFEYPDGNVEKRGPAGFGAIASYWSPRRELTGTYDASWHQNRRPLLPADWDPRSLLCSPADQRTNGYLAGSEAVELTNLTPDGFLSFALPKVYLTFSTNHDGQMKEHRSRLSTVIIEPDFPRVIMVWLTTLPCLINGEYLEYTVIREKPYI